VGSTWISGVTFFHDDLLNNRPVLLLEHSLDDVDLIVDHLLQSRQLLIGVVFLIH